MDDNTTLSEMQRSIDEHIALRALTRIVPDKWSPQRLQWLWECLMTQDYAYDDLAKGNPQAFLGPLFAGMGEWYEIGNSGLILVNGIVPKCNADIHYVVWDVELSVKDILALARTVMDDLFIRLELNHLTAFIPAFNKQAIRLATLNGFKYEGELRKVFLKNGKYHNVQIHGILREEFYRSVPRKEIQ